MTLISYFNQSKENRNKNNFLGVLIVVVGKKNFALNLGKSFN